VNVHKHAAIRAARNMQQFEQPAHRRRPARYGDRRVLWRQLDDAGLGFIGRLRVGRCLSHSVTLSCGLQRGRYLVDAGDCIACHTSERVPAFFCGIAVLRQCSTGRHAAIHPLHRDVDEICATAQRAPTQPSSKEPDDLKARRKVPAGLRPNGTARVRNGSPSGDGAYWHPQGLA
jgi:hypothetical protein